MPLLEPQFKGGFHLLTQSATEAYPTPAHTPDAISALWAHTEEVLNPLLDA